ncbi:MAG: DMT family transporter [Clostridia bacterium]|nr:DMT family transporter [Clostridia bacterium]
MKTEKNGYLYLLITVMLFSTYEAVVKTLVNKIDPFQINFIRFLVGGLILFVFLLVKSDIKISMNDFFWLVGVGIINVVLSMSLMQLSLYMKGAQASVSAVVFSSNPIFVAVFAAIMDREKLSVNKIAGLFIGLIGILVIFEDKFITGFSDFKSPFFALLSAVFYGLYTVLGRRLSIRLGSLKMNAYSFIFGSVALLPLLLFFRIPVVRFDYSGLWQVVYLSVFVTGLAYLSYFKGLSIAGASKGSLVFFVKPALASAIAVIFLKEQMTVNLVIGTVLVILGITTVIYWNGFKEKIASNLKDFCIKWRINK